MIKKLENILKKAKGGKIDMKSFLKKEKESFIQLGKKVYCKECRHIKNENCYEKICNHQKNLYKATIENYYTITTYISHHKTPTELNGKNNCKWYEEKV